MARMGMAADSRWAGGSARVLFGMTFQTRSLVLGVCSVQLSGRRQKETVLPAFLSVCIKLRLRSKLANDSGAEVSVAGNRLAVVAVVAVAE